MKTKAEVEVHEVIGIELNSNVKVLFCEENRKNELHE